MPRSSFVGKRSTYYEGTTATTTTITKPTTKPTLPPLPLYREHNLTIDTIINTHKSIQDSIYYVNFINNLIDTHFDAIKLAKDIKSVISEKVVSNFFKLDNVAGDYFWINDVPDNTDTDSILKSMSYYTYKEYDNLLSDKTIIEIQSQGDESLANLLIDETTNYINILNKLKSQKKENNYTFLNIKTWTNGMKLEYLIFRRLPWAPTKWIVIGSGVNLNNYLPNSNNKYILSKEYQRLISNIADNINTRSAAADYFTYGSVLDFNNLKCIRSLKYPYWNNQYFTQCYIKNSNEDIPTKYKSINTPKSATKKNNIPNITA